MKHQLVFLTLAFTLVACMQVEMPATSTTEPPTAAFVTMTLEPPTETPVVATETPTLEPTTTTVARSKPWRIWFRGFSCEHRGECGPSPDAPYDYFSILSDGTALEPLNISSFPTTVEVPQGAPKPWPDPATSPQLSPNGALVAYMSVDSNNKGQLYTVNMVNTQATLVYSAERTDPDTLNSIGAICWSPDGQYLRFLLMSRRGNDPQPPVVYSVAPDGSNLTEMFTLDGLEGSWPAGCSPDGQEIALFVGLVSDGTRHGLYRVSLLDGHWQHLLATYYIAQIRTAPIEFQP